MPLHPQARAYLDAIAQGPATAALAPDAARRLTYERRTALPRGPEARVDDMAVATRGGEIPARLYRPSSAAGPLPVLVWFHGGGYVVGGLAESDSECRQLATQTPCAVLSVGYRLAPEHPFPAAADDAFDATLWVAAHAAELQLDPERIAVGGDSCGGTLAAVVTLRLRARGGPVPRLQVLVYPITDMASFDTPSYRDCAAGYGLTRASMEWFRGHYLPRAGDRGHPDASPLRASDLAGLPPALVLTAEFDPLRDEGEAYARALAAAGVPVTQRRYDGMVHGFYVLHALFDDGQRALGETADALRAAFASA